MGFERFFVWMFIVSDSLLTIFVVVKIIQRTKYQTITTLISVVLCAKLCVIPFYPKNCRTINIFQI
jgi:hypothetical protein